MTSVSSALLSWRGSSASSTIGMPRARAATQMSRTNAGKRLSAITASASATSAAGVVRPRRDQALVAVVDDRALAAPVDADRRDRRGHARDARAGRAIDVLVRREREERVADGVDAGGPPSGPAKLARAPRCAIATAAFAALPPLTVRNSLACVFTSGRGKCGDAEHHVEHRDAGAQHVLAASARRHRRPPRPRRG